MPCHIISLLDVIWCPVHWGALRVTYSFVNSFNIYATWNASLTLYYTKILISLKTKGCQFWQLCRHWWHSSKLSLRQLTVPHVTTKSCQIDDLLFSVYCISPTHHHHHHHHHHTTHDTHWSLNCFINTTLNTVYHPLFWQADISHAHGPQLAVFEICNAYKYMSWLICSRTLFYEFRAFQ